MYQKRGEFHPHITNKNITMFWNMSVTLADQCPFRGQQQLSSDMCQMFLKEHSYKHFVEDKTQLQYFLVTKQCN